MKNSITKIIRLLGLIVFLFASSFSFAQGIQDEEHQITGRVYPSGLQTPMRDVAVQIEGKPGTLQITKDDGIFEFYVPSFPVNLVFTKESYQSQVVTVKKPGDISVYLEAAKKVVNDYGQTVGVRVSLNTDSRDGILVLSSTDNRFRYWFDNRVYFDGAAYFGDNVYQGEENKIGSGVNLRRVRFAMKTILWGHWGGEIDFDFADNQVDLKDAYARYISKRWQIKAGQFREPFSLETMTTSRYILLMERPYATEQAPSRHLGIDYKVFTNHFFFEGGLFSSEAWNDLFKF